MSQISGETARGEDLKTEVQTEPPRLSNFASPLSVGSEPATPVPSLKA